MNKQKNMWGSLFHFCSLALSHMSPYAYCFTLYIRKMSHAHWYCGSYDICVAAAPECHLCARLLLYFLGRLSQQHVFFMK